MLMQLKQKVKQNVKKKIGLK